MQSTTYRWRLSASAVTGLSLIAAGADLAGLGGGRPWLRDAALISCCLLALARALRSRGARAGWTLMSLGLLSAELGSLLDAGQYPGLAIPFFLAVYPCQALAMYLLLRGRLRPLDPATILDGVICGVGTATLIAVLLFGLLQDHVVGSVNPLYPVLDLLIITVLGVVVAVSGWRVTKGLGLCLVAVALSACADAAYAVQTAQSSYLAGHWVDAIWVLAFLCAALASGRELLPVQAPSARVPHLAQLLLPVAWIVVSGVIRGLDRVVELPIEVLVLGVVTSSLSIVRIILSVRDVQSLAASRLEARTDALTGLPNRRALYERLAAELDGGLVALLLLDLDGFKDVNDSLGHDHGDALLTDIGPRLQTLLRPHDLLCRLGGDEFAMVLPDTGGAEAFDLARQLLQSLQQPFELDHVRVHVGGSIGIAHSPLHGLDVVALLRKADIAMYQAKAVGDCVSLYGESDADPSRERLQTVDLLRRAMSTELDDSLVLHYQPKLVLASGRVSGVEALLRWRDEHGALRLPHTFLPLAERAGLMVALSDKVLGMALDQIVIWAGQGMHDVNVAINLPACALGDAGLVARVETALGERGLAGPVLTLEITEQSLMADRVAASQVLQALRTLGVKISIDDFGTGYSSLAYLRDLPVDELKLDRAFVKPLVTDKRAAALVRSTIDLTHSLGLRMVAEGVEDRQTWDELHRFGCDEVQGFYLTPAVPADVVVAWLDSHPRTDLTVPDPSVTV